MDRDDGKPDRLFQAAYGKDFSIALRRAVDLLHQPGAGRSDGSRLLAPHTLQDRTIRTRDRRLQGDLHGYRPGLEPRTR